MMNPAHRGKGRRSYRQEARWQQEFMSLSRQIVPTQRRLPYGFRNQPFAFASLVKNFSSRSATFSRPAGPGWVPSFGKSSLV